MARPRDRQACRCVAMRADFGELLECGPCRVRRVHDELRADDYVPIEVDVRWFYTGLGVPMRTVAESRTAWVPRWALTMTQALPGAAVLKAVVTRSLDDVAFRDAVLSIVALHRLPSQVNTAVEEFVRAQQ